MIKSFELAYLFLKDLAAQEPGNALALVGAEPGAGALVPPGPDAGAAPIADHGAGAVVPTGPEASAAPIADNGAGAVVPAAGQDGVVPGLSRDHEIRNLLAEFDAESIESSQGTEDADSLSEEAADSEDLDGEPFDVDEDAAFQADSLPEAAGSKDLDGADSLSAKATDSEDLDGEPFDVNEDAAFQADSLPEAAGSKDIDGAESLSAEATDSEDLDGNESGEGDSHDSQATTVILGQHLDEEDMPAWFKLWQTPEKEDQIDDEDLKPPSPPSKKSRIIYGEAEKIPDNKHYDQVPVEFWDSEADVPVQGHIVVFKDSTTSLEKE